MSKPFSDEFRNAAISKALSRGKDVTLEDIVREIGISRSTLNRWIRESQSTSKEVVESMKAREKRPGDWNAAERFQAVMDCQDLDEKTVSAYCRKRGLYPHHIAQWKANFLQEEVPVDRSQVKKLKEENKQLKRELHRKDKALAETAALLVLKKNWIRSWETKRTADHGIKTSNDFGWGV